MSSNRRGVPPQYRPAANRGFTSEQLPLVSPYEVGPADSISTHNTSQDIRAGLRSVPQVAQGTENLANQSPTKDDMSKPVLFYGKPNQLEDVITFCDVKILVDGLTSDERKCGLLASLFRGQALHWLTSQLKSSPKLLTEDYEDFKFNVKNAFGLSAEAATAKAARRLATISQRGPCQLYAIEFRQVSDALGLDDATARASFQRGLKLHVREAVVTTGPHSTLSDLIEEAVRIDTELYNARRQARSGGRQQGKGSGGTIKCHSCGKFGHKASECRIKREQF